MRPSAAADVSPGEVIDASNWEKVKGLLPEPVVAWVRKGELTLHIGELEVDPKEMFPPHTRQAYQTNVGKYDVDEDSGIIETGTGKIAEFISGFPFPEIDPKDPKAGEKIMHNKNYANFQYGDFRFRSQLIWVGRSSGYEREAEIELLQSARTGWPGAEGIPNPDGLEKCFIIGVKKPYDVAGTAVMTHRFLSAHKLDNTFGYLPAIRRVRRMSAANRSDGFVGTDQCVDDSSGYDGKVAAFHWKFLRKEEMLRPFLAAHTFPLVKNRREEWQSTKDVKRVTYGYEVDGWQGAPWNPTNLIWVKRPMYALEMTPKDKYYNYGTHYIWISTETWSATYKVIHDRGGLYWKTLFTAAAFVQSADKTTRFVAGPCQNVVDERYDHATVTKILCPENIWTFFARVNPNDFTLAGFQKYCK
jgi:hypothetical protein